MKTYLRSMIGQTQLNSKALIYIEREFVNRVTTKNIEKLLMCFSCLLNVWKSTNIVLFKLPSFSGIKCITVLGKRLVIRNEKDSAPPDKGLQKRL